MAVLRLQNTYLVPSSILSKGIIPQSQGFYSQALELKHLFEIGQHAMKHKDWTWAKDWLNTALTKFDVDNDQIFDGIERYNILDLLAIAEYKVSRKFLLQIRSI